MDASNPSTRGLRREILIALGVLFILGYAWMPTAGVSSPNERSRIYLAVSLVDQHTLTIDGPIARFGMIYDLARANGHYFTDKAPGTSLLAAAVYGAGRLFFPASAFPIETLLSLMRRSIMLPFGVLGFLLFRRLARRLELAESSVDLASLTWILGTAATHASAGFFGHQIVSVCLLGALLLLLRAERLTIEGKRAWPLCLGAGLIAGFSVLTEYQSAIPFGLLSLYALAGPLRLQPARLIWFVLGTLPGAVGLLAYNKLAFGGIFQLSYHHLVSPELRQMHGKGIGGVALPKWEYAHGALLSWHRGLFSTAPFFLLAGPGLLALWRQGRRRLALLIGAAFAYYLLFVCSTEIWYGGWGFGPRLMVPMMGWTALAAGFGLASLRKSWTKGIALGLCLWGVAYTQLVNAIFPELPERFTHPLLDLVPAALREGALVPNLATRILGWHGLVSLLPLIAMLVLLLVMSVRAYVRATRGGWSRFLLGLCGVGVLGSFLLLARWSGPGAAPASTASQVQWMHRLLAAETALWKKP